MENMYLFQLTCLYRRIQQTAQQWRLQCGTIYNSVERSQLLVSRIPIFDQIDQKLRSNYASIIQLIFVFLARNLSLSLSVYIYIYIYIYICVCVCVCIYVCVRVQRGVAYANDQRNNDNILQAYHVKGFRHIFDT